MMYTSRSNHERHAGIDLQLAVLSHIHTPILVLSPTHTAIFANRALERLLGSADPIQSSGGLVGRSVGQIGIKLLYYRTWETVLHNLASASKEGRSSESGYGEKDPIHEADVVLDNPNIRFGDRHFRAVISTLACENSLNFMISLERSNQNIRKPDLPDLLHHRDSRSSDEAISVTSPTEHKRQREHRGSTNSAFSNSVDVLKLKQSIFDSLSIMSFFVTADEKFYLTNKYAREVVGDIMGDELGCDGANIRQRLEIWDEEFTRKLDDAEYPGLKIVRNRKPFADYRCGFMHATTGQKLVMTAHGECLYDDDTGEFLGGICWFRDIQDHSDFLVSSQAKLIRSYETICDLMPHLVWTATTDGLVDWFSKRWYDFTGLAREDSIGAGFAHAIHEEDLAELLKRWNYFRERGEDCEVEVRYRRKDGVYRWMLVRAVPLRADNGEILKWYGTTTDINELVIARIDAARNKLQMLTVLAHAEVNMFAVNQDRIVTMAEGGMQWHSESESYNVEQKSSLVGKDAILVAQQTQPGGVPGYEKNVLDVLSGRVGVAQSEDTIGDKTYRTRVVADLEFDAEDGAGKPVVKGALGLSIDITDVKARASLAIENARLTIEEQTAKDSNHMKSQFLANMSHELRTPTAGVIGMAELLGDDPRLTSEQKEYVNSIQLSAKSLLTIVNDILDFSKIESGRLDIEEVPFNLSCVTGELCKILSMFAQQKSLEFIYENNMEQDVEVLGDPGRVRQVLSNLLTNALKFTRDGHVKLIVSSMRKSTDLGAGETIEVTFLVEDTGIGMEQSVLQKLFKPFSQGDASTARLYGGTGLGLTISQNLASLMHGFIKLESQPGEGSRATFMVPFKVSSWHEEPHIRSSSPPNPGFRWSKPSIWTQSCTPRTLNQDTLNQQISSSVTEFTPSSLPRSRKGSIAPMLSRHSSIDAITSLPTDLTPEQRSRFHVLVVEDNAINQTIAIKNIRKLGFPVTAVWNGKEALSYLRTPSSTQPRPGIILMDVQMPVMDGYEATRILRTSKDYSDNNPRQTLENVEEGFQLEGETKAVTIPEPKRRERDRSLHRQISGGMISNGLQQQQLRDIPVIAMTASAISGDKEKCHEAGMDDYLSKPVNKKQLEEMILKWVGRRR